ncbi:MULTISPECIES: helix-turn-helix domain-containing protein [Clostridia]|uniref:helix-turn-helix domain-containing protein n=1 Tax=Clostridia TaxID=186801 RepID=UPI001FAE5E8A|nr:MULTISPECIES: helix-turn-helix domain-containing protein [Clostridia]MCQ4933412.1 helix-turn-helix domain-containing protein [Blautia faecis]MDB8779556.1 helix-turn-helix domain-containing protein [Ruminococcus sp. 1001136sp1]
MKSLALFRSNEYNYISFQNPKYRFEVPQVNGYITVQEAAEKWGVTPRQVQILCKENRIVGAMRMSHIWIIPENAQKPTNTKRTSNKTGGKKFAATHSV